MDFGRESTTQVIRSTYVVLAVVCSPQPLFFVAARLITPYGVYTLHLLVRYYDSVIVTLVHLSSFLPREDVHTQRSSKVKVK